LACQFQDFGEGSKTFTTLSARIAKNAEHIIIPPGPFARNAGGTA